MRINVRWLGPYVYRGSNFSVLNFIVVTVATERVHAENDIPRVPRAMISHGTVLAIFRAAARLV